MPDHGYIKTHALQLPKKIGRGNSHQEYRGHSLLIVKIVGFCPFATTDPYGCSHERSQIISISNTPVFHDHPEIKTSTQLELFDLSQFHLRYVSRRPPNRKHPRGKATQLLIGI